MINKSLIFGTDSNSLLRMLSIANRQGKPIPVPSFRVLKLGTQKSSLFLAKSYHQLCHFEKFAAALTEW
jgi:hypothetical protein